MCSFLTLISSRQSHIGLYSMCGPTYCLSALIYLGRGGWRNCCVVRFLWVARMAALVGPSCHFSSGNANGSDTVVFSKRRPKPAVCAPLTHKDVWAKMDESIQDGSNRIRWGEICLSSAPWTFVEHVSCNHVVALQRLWRRKTQPECTTCVSCYVVMVVAGLFIEVRGSFHSLSPWLSCALHWNHHLAKLTLLSSC